MIKSTKYLILVLALIIVFGFGYGIGKTSAPQVSRVAQLSPETIEKQVVEKLEQSLNSKTEKGLIPLSFSLEEELKRTFLNGEILSKEGNTLKVRVPNGYDGGKFFDYLKEPDYYTKLVKVETGAKIVKLIPKEITEMPVPPEETTEMPVFPEEWSPFEEKEMSIKELTKGMEVSVESKSEFRLEEKGEIVAKNISVAAE